MALTFQQKIELLAKHGGLHIGRPRTETTKAMSECGDGDGYEIGFDAASQDPGWGATVEAALDDYLRKTQKEAVRRATQARAAAEKYTQAAVESEALAQAIMEP